MRQGTKWRLRAAAALLTLAATTAVSAAPPVFTGDVTDYGRNRWRTHYSPSEPEYPMADGAQAIWEVPLGLSRSQPLVVRRDWNGTGRPETRIFHIAGDRLWALNGEMIPSPRAPGQSVEAYRDQLRREGFILWDTPAASLCTNQALLAKDDLLNQACSLQGPSTIARPFASSQAAYAKGVTPADDVIYAGFGHPASVVAIRPTDGKMLGGFIVETNGDRGIVGAPLVFPGDKVVIGTTNGDGFILKGLASGTVSPRVLWIGGRISFSPVPLGETGFLIASDARYTPEIGTHGYMMAYGLGTGAGDEFSPRWAAAVKTDAGIPGEAAIDDQTVYFADKYGKLYALRLDTGEPLWCRQFPGLGPCQPGRAGQPAFINNGPGVDENQVYFVFRNNQGPNVGGGQVIAINKATGQVAWSRAMEFDGNTAPVPMAHVVLVGDTGGYVRAYDKATGQPVNYGGYPLKLSSEPYRSGDQGERWWEPIGGTATQMTVAAGLMLVGVNSTSEERTVLKAYRLHPLINLKLVYLDTPATADANGFNATVKAVCVGCTETLTTSISLTIGGYQLPRRAVTFRAENGYTAAVSWNSGPQPPGSVVPVVATIDPDNAVAEADKNDNTLSATVTILMPAETGPDDGWGSTLTH